MYHRLGTDSLKQRREGYSFKAREDDLSDLPTEFSWEETLGEVRDQGRCGSCYAWSFIGMVESRLRIREGRSVQLSVQWAIDCNQYNQGCKGGFSQAMGRYANEVGLVERRCREYSGNRMPCK